MTSLLAHRGPDDGGTCIEAAARSDIALGNRRLAILDLSPAGHQPMTTTDGRFTLTYNGEIYNYIELRKELGGEFRSSSDTEVVLRSFSRWGVQSFDRLNGMFAFAIWDNAQQMLYAVRDRFGVKPLYYAEHDGGLYFASEIKSLAAAGVPIEPDLDTWRLYLTLGMYEHDERTFFKGVRRLRGGCYLTWQNGHTSIRSWYDLADRLANQPLDSRPENVVGDEYRSLLVDSVRLRFRSDVPVGVCLSGGLDSSILVGVLHELFGSEAAVHAYHFATGDPSYDETSWVTELLRDSNYPLHISLLQPNRIPDLTEEISYYQEEPFGGFPTLAMVELFRQARSCGTIVLLDGQGLDEQWGGYDYYKRALTGARPVLTGPVQGSHSQPTRPECLSADFQRGIEPIVFPLPFGEMLQNWRYRDLRYSKIPRALRFSDKASSQTSCELREPFLDYRLVELAFRQPPDRLIRGGEQKYLLRRIAATLLPRKVAEAPKRPVQTPQREWLRGPLREWVESCLSSSAVAESGWFDRSALRAEWDCYLHGDSDNSFYVWQWISVAMGSLVRDRLRELADGEFNDVVVRARASGGT